MHQDVQGPIEQLDAHAEKLHLLSASMKVRCKDPEGPRLETDSMLFRDAPTSVRSTYESWMLRNVNLCALAALLGAVHCRQLLTS